MELTTGLRYRVASGLGTVVLTVLSIAVANHPFAQRLLTSLPLFGRLEPTTLTNGALTLAAVTALVVVFAALLPLFKPRPRRILDTISLAVRRLLGACLALAAIGYLDYTYRLPRTTLVTMTVLLCCCLPVWFVVIRRRPVAGSERVVLVGDDPGAMEELLETTDLSVVGYVAPTIQYDPAPTNGEPPVRFADGGTHQRAGLDDLECLGGLSRLGETFVEHDIDTAVLAFERSDRADFFSALAECYDHGVRAKAHRKHVDSVLTTDTSVVGLVDIELEPWDWEDRALKRAFDVVFAAIGLVVLLPIIVPIAVAVKLDSPGPVLYGQERTAEFGETFEIKKFRSMVDDAEATTGAKLSEEDSGGVDPRVTRTGRVLRRTHLDEIPQLWSILVGDMAVVGPRPERPELDADIETGVAEWRRRWFVKPGLTGFAQINGATGHEPEQKLRYDTQYIHQQSFWIDVKIVVRQVWQVVSEAASVFADDE
ncbi:sugar transferase [Halococcus agarilyticus]|uniref:sugar transferase n=1 Tax=Halococcus agarilyticus TaxID=1232219 RepID=UPI000677CFA6|nr:sugar transferase [Halococcus agarilyticus]